MCKTEHTVVKNIAPARNGLIVMTIKLFVSFPAERHQQEIDSEDLDLAEINTS